jgi:hypothetical protein
LEGSDRGAGAASSYGQIRSITLLFDWRRWPEVIEELGRRAGQPVAAADALQVDGRIFAMVRHGGPVLKLPQDRVADLVARGDGTPFDAGKGKPMKQWVVLERGTPEEWRSMAEEALAFVGGGEAGRRR